MAYLAQAALAFMTAIATFFSAPILLDKKKPPGDKPDGQELSS